MTDKEQQLRTSRAWRNTPAEDRCALLSNLIRAQVLKVTFGLSSQRLTPEVASRLAFDQLPELVQGCFREGILKGGFALAAR